MKSSKPNSSSFYLKTESAMLLATRMLIEGYDPAISDIRMSPRMAKMVAESLAHSFVEDRNSFSLPPVPDFEIPASSRQSQSQSQSNQGQSNQQGQGETSQTDPTTIFQQRTDVAVKFLQRAVKMIEQGSLAIGDLTLLAHDTLKAPIQAVLQAIIDASNKLEDEGIPKLKGIEKSAISTGALRPISDAKTKMVLNKQRHARQLAAAMPQKQGKKNATWPTLPPKKRPVAKGDTQATIPPQQQMGRDVPKGSITFPGFRSSASSQSIAAMAAETFSEFAMNESILLEKKNATYKHGVAMFDMPSEIASKVKQWQKKHIDKDDIYESEEDNSLGLEDEIHATILYGLRNEDLDKIRELVADFGPVELTLDGLMIFDNADNDRPFEVLNVKVKGNDIQRLHKLIKDSVPNEHKWPDFKAHLCIGYLKKGTGQKYKDLKAPFEGEKVIFDKFTFKEGGEPGKRKKEKVKLGSE